MAGRRSVTGLERWGERLKGILLAMVAVGLLVGLFSQSGFGGSQFLETLGRMLDSMRVHILLGCLPAAALLSLAGLRRTALLCALVALAGLGAIAVDYQSRAARPGRDTDLTLLWFNVLRSNATPPGVIAAALRESGADILALAEADPLMSVADDLADLYPYRLGCTDAERCNLLILSRLPFDKAKLEPLEAGPERFADIELSVAGEWLSILAVHMVKPWYLSMSHRDRLSLEHVLWRERRPRRIVVGDFNAAPWSRELLTIERRHPLRHARIPVATWPASMGVAGIPIDHLMLEGDVALTGLSAWGGDLASNHRGLLARIELSRPGP